MGDVAGVVHNVDVFIALVALHGEVGGELLIHDADGFCSPALGDLSARRVGD